MSTQKYFIIFLQHLKRINKYGRINKESNLYKFEISADSPKELNEKMMDFAKELMGETHIPMQSELPQYVDDAPSISQIEIPAIPVVAPVIPSSVTKQTATGDRDSKGFPWDGRIHSSSKSFNKDGIWRLVRKVDGAVLAQVENELRNGGAEPKVFTAPPTPLATMPVEVPVFSSAPTIAPVILDTPIKVAPTYENIPMPTNAVRPAHSLITFKNNLMILIAQLINEGKITHEWVEQVKQHFGVKEIWNILHSEKQCIELFNAFIQHEFITEVE